VGQNIRGNHPDQVEQNEEADDPDPGEVEYVMEEGDIDVGDEGIEDAIQGVEDELEDKEGDPER
jgi:hypothetical protein